jgi:MFS transporter, PAT family, beta-lactamase induction signal transducer AmpG
MSQAAEKTSQVAIEQRRHENPPWLFGILNCGFNYWGVQSLLIPFLLRQHGVSTDRIAGVVAFAMIPSTWCFVWSPIVDLGLKRRTWVLLTTFVSAPLYGLAIFETTSSAAWVTGLLFAANLVTSPGGSAVGAVMSAVGAEDRGKASGWFQAGNIGAGTLLGGASVWLSGRAGLPVLAAAASALCALPALAAFWIVEKPHPKLAPGPLFNALGRDLRDLLWRGSTALGLLFFLSPVGSGAITNLISSVSPDYHASASEVAWVTGAGGGLLLAMGGLAGGFLCDRLHRMTAYALSGILISFADLWLRLGSATPFTYGAGYGAYAFATGLSFACCTALTLEVLGRGRRAAGTGYSLLGSAVNVPVAYMTWICGIGYKNGGAHGLMLMDALGNGATGVLLLLIARYCAARWKAQPAAVDTSGIA